MSILVRPAVIKSSTKKAAQKAAGSTGLFYPQLNGLRFVFILMVLIHHWGPQTLFERFRIGWVGVDLFYVLSGFLIGEILLREKETTKSTSHSIRNFIIRRALRIFPLYYTVILLYAFFVSGSDMLVWNLTYTNNIYQAFHLDQVKEEFWHIWSLCVEEQFYLLFPFLVFFASLRYIKPILLYGILLSVVGRVLSTWLGDMPDPHILMPFCLDSLFLGVLLAYLKNYQPVFLLKLLGSQARSLLLVATSVAALTILCYFNNTVGVYGFLRLLGSIGGFFLIGYSVMKGYRGKLKIFLENKAIALLGKISYGIYLIHPFIERLWYKTAEQNQVRNFFIGLQKPVISNRYVIDFFFLFTITVAISYLSFFYFEKRFLKLKVLFT
ncbi:MAG: acyltransferase [Bacteroidota bacterium]|nr:acyltransferase [Bacteroidota bacterium]